MAQALSAYELSRAENIKANQQMLHALGLEAVVEKAPRASANKPSRPPPPPPSRASGRVASLAKPNYVASGLALDAPGALDERGGGGLRRRRALSTPQFGSDRERSAYGAAAQAVAETCKACGHGSAFLIWMTESKVSGGFWCSLPVGFYEAHMPAYDVPVLLEGEGGDAWEVRYLARGGFSGGWRGYAIDQRIAAGDTVMFEVQDAEGAEAGEVRRMRTRVFRGGGVAGGDNWPARLVKGVHTSSVAAKRAMRDAKKPPPSRTKAPTPKASAASKKAPSSISKPRAGGGDGEYALDAILGLAVAAEGGPLALVRWEADEVEDSWEPFSEVAHCSDELGVFVRSRLEEGPAACTFPSLRALWTRLCRRFAADVAVAWNPASSISAIATATAAKPSSAAGTAKPKPATSKPSTAAKPAAAARLAAAKRPVSCAPAAMAGEKRLKRNQGGMTGGAVVAQSAATCPADGAPNGDGGNPVVGDPHALVGARIDIWWDGDGRWYGGHVAEYRPSSRAHVVHYDDGDVKPHVLDDEMAWRRASR